MNGLTEKQVQVSRDKYGLNVLKQRKQKTKSKILLEILKDPIILIMLGAMILSILSNVDDKHFSEAFVIMLLVVINVVISFVQEVKTLAKLKSLEQMNEDKVVVIRAGKKMQIKAKYLVVGDLVELKIGAIARADMQVIVSHDLRVDESFLTGETDLVYKDEEKCIYSNSPIKNGYGYASVTQVGMNTKIGEIAQSVDEVLVVKSQLELKILQITKILLKIAICVGIIIFVLTLLTTKSLEISFSFAISILIATVPEGLATVLAIVLTFMAQKMAQNKALIKKTALLETLGEVSFVCTDKTGTITENNMQVTEAKYYESEQITHCMVSSVVDQDSPTTTAISKYLEQFQMISKGSLIVEAIIPFSSTIKKSMHLVTNKNEKQVIAIGAPDVLVQSDQVLADVKKYASAGLRTILVASADVSGDYELSVNTPSLKPLCLFGIQDPPKISAIDTVNEFHQAHIQPVMITGDNEITAKAIAMQTNIINNDDDICLNKHELDQLSDQEFGEIVEHVKVYSRVSPTDKVRIVSALQAKGNIVAMTGDGTNDSIALKKANVGIAMGVNGTDIAKDAADLILLDDQFQTISVAIQGGRLIFTNLRKFIRQMLTSNTAHTASILLTLLLSLCTGQYLVLPLTPILILWINIVSDAIPCLALGLEQPESNIMQKRPIDPDLNILTKTMIIEILLRGITIGLFVLIAFKYALAQTQDVQVARTVGFIVLSFGQLIHIFDARSENTIYQKNPFSNKWLIITVLISACLNLLIVYSPLNIIFELKVVKLKILVVAILFASFPTFFYSLGKLVVIKRGKNARKN